MANVNKKEDYIEVTCEPLHGIGKLVGFKRTVVLVDKSSLHEGLNDFTCDHFRSDGRTSLFPVHIYISLDTCSGNDRVPRFDRKPTGDCAGCVHKAAGREVWFYWGNDSYPED